MSHIFVIYVYDCFQNINLDMMTFNIAIDKLYFKCFYKSAFSWILLMNIQNIPKHMYYESEIEDSKINES